MVEIATMRHKEQADESPALLSFEVVVELAKHLDPSFNPPSDVLEKDYKWTSAAGCGGGFDTAKHGNASQWMLWYDTLTEHPSSDSATGVWTVHGMAPDHDLRIERHERGNPADYEIIVTGPVSRVRHVISAWRALVRAIPDVSAETARSLLAQASGL